MTFGLIFIIIVLSVFIVMIFGRFVDFNVIINKGEEERQAFDWAELIISNSNLVAEDSNGEKIRGTLNKTMLDQLGGGNNCQGFDKVFVDRQPGPFGLSVKNEETGEQWIICDFGRANTYYPVQIKYPTGETDSGKLFVGLWK